MALTFRVESRLPIHGPNWDKAPIAGPGDGVVYAVVLSNGQLVQPQIQVEYDGQSLGTMIRRPVGPITSILGPKLQLGHSVSAHFFEHPVTRELDCVACAEGQLPPQIVYLLEIRIQPSSTQVIVPSTKCECGAASTGIGKGMAGHSGWCPWKASA